MSRQFTRDQTKIATVKILQTLGYNSTNTLPAEILTDLFGNYIQQITKSLNSYANEFGCTQPNLDHLGLAFRDMGVNVSELEEYVKYVNFGPPPNPAPKYPLPKEDHLNFLKPGSKEVVTRPVHIHEHLPPMNPLLDGNENDVENIKVEEPDESKSETSQVFKKPDIMHADFKRPSFRKEEEGSRPTREISSVMMTTSGFLSPAREGKLPESRTPIPQVDPAPPPSPTPEPAEPVVTKKPVKVLNKKIEGKKTVKRAASASAAAAPHSESPATGDEKKKRPSTNQLTPNHIKKMKRELAQNVLNQITQNTYEGIKEVSPQANKARQMAKMNRALAAARLKTEKLNTTITPIPSKPQGFQAPPQNDVDNVDKLFTEPDKKKVNILKKISNVKNEKGDGKSKKDELGSRESSPDLIIDEPDELASKLSHLPSDVTIEPINPVVTSKSPEKIEQNPYFDDDSQPGTPSTPKTPEMISHSPPMVKEKRKRKENRKVKKLQKHQSPHRIDSDALDIDMERPKTPEAQGLPKMPPVEMPIIPIPPHLAPGQFPFFSNFGPSLIPPPIGFGTHLPPYPPTMNLAGPQFGEKPFNNVIPNLAAVLPSNPAAALHSPKLEEFKPNVDKMLAAAPTATTTTTTTPTSTSSSSSTAAANHVADSSLSPKLEKKAKEHKKEKKDKLKKRNKKDKVKSKEEKRKLKDEKKDKIKKEKKEKRKDKESKDADPGLRITLRLDKSPSPCPDVLETRKLNIKPIIKKEDDVINNAEERKRETSPGLAKISALVCGPPKPKAINVAPLQPAYDSFPSSSSDNLNHTKKTLLKPIPKLRTKEIRRDPVDVVPSLPSKYIDAEGNEVWICPACLRQDDGSPMIGCDGCDAWYHWVCVGIQVPPDDSEDWYCRVCLLKKNEDLQSDKQKKKRKKREKKDV